MSGGIRAATIPNNVKKMIQNIKDVTGNHTDDEIYAMLKECSMDPNETAQKLLHQDTFHEVKRKKDRKKETQTNRETVDLKWRQGPPGRGGRGGRGFSSRYAGQDAGTGRHSSVVKENGLNQASDKAGFVSSPTVVHEGDIKDKGSSVTGVANGPIGVLSGDMGNADTSDALLGGAAKQIDTSSRPRSRSGGTKRSNFMSAGKSQPVKPATFSGVYSSASDPVLDPSSDKRVPAVGAIKRAVGNQRSAVEPSSNVSAEDKLNLADTGNLIQGKMGGKSQGSDKNPAAEYLLSSSSSQGSSSSSRPSSNYGNRSQQAMVSQKVGHTKEWKPKPTNAISAQESKIAAATEATNVASEILARIQPAERVIDVEEGINKLQQKPEQKPENRHATDGQNVIIPHHIHVPDAVRTGLSFGSFDSALVVAPNRSAAPENEDMNPVSVAHLVNENIVEEQAASDNSRPAENPEFIDLSQTSEQADNSSSGDVPVPSSSVPDFNDSKETATDHQNSSAHTSAYSFGLMPPVIGNPLGQLKPSETQAPDISRAPGFAVQHHMDPSTFYAQFYRSGPDSDGRVSPFPTHGVASKHNGNVTPFTAQTSQAPPEGASAMGFSTAAHTPHGTQAAGVMPSSIPVTQQPLPLFRQPAGIHIPHYPPNFIPYGHYFSPFYVPLPAMHQFVGNNAFAQQGQPGGVYPAPQTAAAVPTAVKFPLPQYKPGNNVGNSAHMGVGGGYGPYGASPAGFNPGTAATAGNTTANEDLAAAQFKESLYITGQQTEGSAVWFPGPGRDMSNLPTNAYYNLPHGQHVTFAPTQAGQGPYAGIFHPAQGVTAAGVRPLLQQSQGMPGPGDMVGGTASVYQQPEHTQMNWPNNY